MYMYQWQVEGGCRLAVAPGSDDRVIAEADHVEVPIRTDRVPFHVFSHDSPPAPYIQLSLTSDHVLRTVPFLRGIIANSP